MEILSKEPPWHDCGDTDAMGWEEIAEMVTRCKTPYIALHCV